MPRCEPDHRARFVALVKEEPEHPFERALWNLRRGRSTSDVVEQALELHESESRDSLRGWLLATTVDEDISRRTQISVDVLKAYRHLFFDRATFRHHFDVITWAKRLVNDPRSTTEGMQYIRWAIMYGVESIAYMSGLPTYVDARDVQERAMIEGHFRGLSGRDNTIDSAAAKEALRHQQMAVSQAAVLAKAAPPSARDFAVKLKHREMTSSIEFVDQTTEVLH